MRQLIDQIDLSDFPVEWKFRKYYNHLYLLHLSEHDGSSQSVIRLTTASASPSLG